MLGHTSSLAWVGALILIILYWQDRFYAIDCGSYTLAASKIHSYTSEILSRDPLMIYIDSFLSLQETEHVLSLCKELFKPSLVYTRGEEVDPSYRTSTSCVLSSKDDMTKLIEARASAFLGFLEHDGIEAIQLVHYEPGGMFALHHDWFTTPIDDINGRPYNRFASFFIYLESDFTGGQTYFPKLQLPSNPSIDDPRFSSKLDGTGLGILPPVGSGIFWLNLHANDTGDERTLHAGLPIGSGSKTGMNIWIKKLTK